MEISRLTSSLMTDIEPSESEILSLSLPLIGDAEDNITVSTTHSEDTISNVTVKESTDMTTFDIASPRIDHVVVERSSREAENRSLSTAVGSGPSGSLSTFVEDGSSSSFAEDGSLSTAVWSDVLKKVAFISQPPSQTAVTKMATEKRPPSLHLDEPSYDSCAFVEPPHHLCPHLPSLLSFPDTCWSGMVDQDLLTHIGPCERNRQEVMWEIVASEER